MDISNFEDPQKYDEYYRAITMGAEAIIKSMDVFNKVINSIVEIAMTSWLVL